MGEFTERENPIRYVDDPALAWVSERHRPFMGRMSRQRPIRRAVRVKTVQRIPRRLMPICSQKQDGPTFVDLHRLTPESKQVAELKALTRDQGSLIQMQTRLVNQLPACLKDYYPVALPLFSKLQQKSTLLFLQTYPTPQKAMGATREQITKTLKEAGHTRADVTAAKIFETLHQPHLYAGEVTTRTKSRLMLALTAQQRL